MEFIIDRDTFLKSLGRANGIIEKKTTLPILSNILIEAKESKIKITATDLDIIYFEEIIPQEIKKEGSTTTSANILYDILRKLQSNVKVELTLFNKIERHYLAKLPDSEEAIITDNTKVINTLNSLCIEMDDRYELLKQAMVRNIMEYNVKFKARKLNPENGHRFLPYIVLVIDEFADLIMTAGKEVETPIARLAQLARAIGIHLIIATQRPSVNVITGIIKANFPARIAFRVTSKIDSRTILDGSGLSRQNRMSPDQIVSVLQDMYRDLGVYPEFVAALGVMGRDGNVLKRMNGHSGSEKARVKTGTLSFVSALSGYFQSADGEMFAFSMLIGIISGTYSTIFIAAAIATLITERKTAQREKVEAIPASGVSRRSNKRRR